ncbi:MAG TPA: LysM domain-containing protein [Solirubrobacterales bacterium]|nr:LysM domain-containing protein [Solirubrobacterales bacterium]
MNKRTSAATRLVAALALIGAVLVVIVVIAGAMDGDSSSPKERTERPAKQNKREPTTKKKTYTVQPGDTLTAIAHKTGVPVAEILALNPEADPQILIAGQTLKLR